MIDGFELPQQLARPLWGTVDMLLFGVKNGGCLSVKQAICADITRTVGIYCSRIGDLTGKHAGRLQHVDLYEENRVFKHVNSGYTFLKQLHRDVWNNETKSTVKMGTCQHQSGPEFCHVKFPLVF